MPKEKVVELGDVCQLLSGGTPSKERDDYWGGNIPWVTARDLKTSFLERTGISLTSLGASGLKRAPAGAILVLVRGMTLFKDVPITILSQPMCFNQDIKALIVDERQSSRYLAYQLIARKAQIQRLVDSAGHGTGRLNTDLLKSLPLKFPSLAEQEKVASSLVAVDQRLELLRQKATELRAFKAGLMQKLFSQEIRFTRDDGSEFPDWENKRLSEVFDEVDDKVGQRALPTFSISAGRGFVSQAEKFGRDISGQQNERYTVLSEGDFSYNKGNSKQYQFGCIYPNDTGMKIAVPNVFISFRRKAAHSSIGFFAKLFESKFLDRGLRTLISSGARMDGLLNVSKADFFRLSVPFPHPNEQRKIADALTALDTKITAVQSQITEMEAFKKGLLQQMFV